MPVNVKSQMKMLLFILFLTIISQDAAAEIYKWLDRNGNIVYSQSPPPVDANPLKTPEIAGPPDNNGAAGKRVEEIISGEKEARQKRLARRQQQKDARTKKSRNKQLQKNCHKLRENLKIMKSQGRVYIEESAENNRFLNKKELALKTREAEETIKKHCTE